MQILMQDRRECHAGNGFPVGVGSGSCNSGDGYVSIQSVNYPGYYLRHSNYDLSLEKNDGTSLFAESATFKIVPGLADPSYILFSPTISHKIYKALQLLIKIG